MQVETVPMPGSADAVARGCICPRGPNCDGAGYVDADGARWRTYDTDCPLHFPATQDPGAHVS